MKDFKEIIADQIKARKDWGDPNYVPAHWWASAVNNCNRELYYRKIGIKPSIEEMNYFRLVIGDVFHSFMQDLLEEAKINLEPKETKEIHKFLNLTTKNDGRISYQGKDVIVEFKTVSNCYPNFNFNKIRKENKPRKEDILQIHCNMLNFKKEFGLVVYLNMEAVNTGIYKDFLLYFPIKKDQKIIDYIIDKFLFLNQCVQKEIVPEMEPDKCRWCEYKYLCEGKPRKQKKVLKEEK